MCGFVNIFFWNIFKRYLLKNCCCFENVHPSRVFFFKDLTQSFLIILCSFLSLIFVTHGTVIQLSDLGYYLHEEKNLYLYVQIHFKLHFHIHTHDLSLYLSPSHLPCKLHVAKSRVHRLKNAPLFPSRVSYRSICSPSCFVTFIRSHSLALSLSLVAASSLWSLNSLVFVE